VIAIGCIADDFTGGSDVAAALRRAGLSVALIFDAPDTDVDVPPTDAVVIALKTRTIPAVQAVTQSLAALEWLVGHEAARVYFKYCSTFDSTDDGNIGPVADALLRALGETTTIVCPASPEHGRTMYLGHLFVHDRLVSESSMRHHPLTPMTDPNIGRVLGRQTDGNVERLSMSTLRGGPSAVRTVVADMRASGIRHLVTDALDDRDLEVIANGCSDLRLLTGGAGLAGALGSVVAGGTPGASADPPGLPPGPAVILAGSCSTTTLAQVAAAAAVMPSHRLDPVATPEPHDLESEATSWLRANLAGGPVLLYSSAGPDERDRACEAMGPDTSDNLERILGALARTAAELGARRIVVAGGETSGAVVQALGIRSVVVDHEADRGVPWCLTTEEPTLALLLKSGNFGSEDLLVRAAGGA